jgi:myo-inositol-1(or 4)-monophosphatase
VSAPDPDELLALAVDLADRAGALALSMHAGLGAVDTKSSPTDVVTAATRACEQLLVEGHPRRPARRRHPRRGGRVERGHDRRAVGGRPRSTGRSTTSTAIPQWCCSIGVEVDGRRSSGAVYDPAKDELWQAVRGRGATLNGRPLRCTAVTELGPGAGRHRLRVRRAAPRRAGPASCPP